MSVEWDKAWYGITSPLPYIIIVLTPQMNYEGNKLSGYLHHGLHVHEWFTHGGI